MIYLVGLLMVSYFRQRLFESSLMKEMYQVKFLRGAKEKPVGKTVAVMPEIVDSESRIEG
jgi:hypothetical protein